MTKKVFISIIIGCAAVLTLAWIVAVNAKSASTKQITLINKALFYLNNEVYVMAVPLLEQAASYNATHTIKAENELKTAYRGLLHRSEYKSKYKILLEKQMNRKDASPEVFIEAGNFYIKDSKLKTALEILKRGLEKTKNEDIRKLYEQSRYLFELSWARYDDVSAMCDGTAGVMLDGKWGIASKEGALLVSIEYDQISNFAADRVIVRQNNQIFAIDKHGDKLAVSNGDIIGFKNISGGRTILRCEDGWRRGSLELELGAKVFEDIGMYSEQYVSAKVDGKWGVIDLENKWLIEPIYEAIIEDELGKSYGQGIVFVKTEIGVQMNLNGKLQDEIFEDAKPFTEKGFAAVKRNEKWGFINADGEIIIEFQFEDALSFSEDLAAVKIDGLWGYINSDGGLVIKAEFQDAKSFSMGSSPVKTDRGWQFLTLIEFKGGLTL